MRVQFSRNIAQALAVLSATAALAMAPAFAHAAPTVLNFATFGELRGLISGEIDYDSTVSGQSVDGHEEYPITSGSFTFISYGPFAASGGTAEVFPARSILSNPLEDITFETNDGFSLTLSGVPAVFSNGNLALPTSGSFLGTMSSELGGLPVDVTLSTPSVVASAPEPSVWLLLIAAIATIGGALRFSKSNGRRALVALA